MTYSIVACDKDTGLIGVATATGGPVVGSLVPHARARVGAVATQGYTNPLYGTDGLDALAAGQDARAVVDALIAADPGRDRRQLIIVDAQGRTAGWSGAGLSAARAMRLEDGFAVAGNFLAHEGVVGAMARAYAETPGPLDLRLLAALQAGEAAGGDARGTRSAALRTYADQRYPAIDLRVDFSKTPIKDLADILQEVRDGDYADFVAQLPRR